MNRVTQKVLEKEAIRLYGLEGSTNLSIKFKDMTLSLTYDESKEVEETEVKIDSLKGVELKVEEIDNLEQVDELEETPKPAKKRRGRKKKK